MCTHDTSEVGTTELPGTSRWSGTEPLPLGNASQRACTLELCSSRKENKLDKGYKKIMLNKKLKPTGPKNK